MVVTSIDLGSNSFRVLQYDFTQNKVLGECEAVVGTADGLKQTGKISDAAIQRIIDAINTSLEKIDYDPTTAIAVTTSAMRQASNNLEVIEQIKNATGVIFNIISGEEEARLTLNAMKFALNRENIKEQNFILVDIGGGSTELSVVNGDKEFGKSFEYGIVTLSQSKNLKELLENFKESIEEFIKGNHIDKSYVMLSTAGTPTTIAALKHNLNYEIYDSKIVNGTKITLDDLVYYKNYLNTLDKEKADILVGAGRSEYMDAGIEIFKMIFGVFEKQDSIVFDDGLREGVAIDYAMKNGVNL
jgi:exopolyphosphatase/guanosine-5'-triphosphate,3'-diphosphate pyrophosphatase